MFVKCNCQQCGGQFGFDDGDVGTQRICPHCGKVITLFITSTPLPEPKIKNRPTAASWIKAKELELEIENEANQARRVISSEVRREVWRRDEGKCVKCGSRLNLEYDHIIPFSEGGSNTARNIELLCQDCNRAKSASIQ